MKNIALLFGFLFFTIPMFCQVNDVLNYADTLINGYNKFEKEDYAGSLEEYLKVPESDTNYIAAVSEALLSYYYLEQYEEGIELGKSVMNGEYELTPNFFLNLGSVCDKAKKYEQAIKYYDIALKRFPMNNLLYYNKGFSYLQLENYKEAFEQFKISLMINPVYDKAHYQLAVLAMNEGKTTLAILALNTYLLVKPNGPFSNNMLMLLNELCSSKYKDEILPKNIDICPNEDYSEIDLLIENYLGLDKKYKVKTKIQLPFIKQSHLVFEKISQLPESEEFWYRTYVPLLKSIYENNFFEAYSYYISQSSASEKHKKIISDNQSKIKNFVEWFVPVLDKTYRKYYLPFPKKELENVIAYRAYNGFAVNFVGQLNEKETLQGYAEGYFPNGAIGSTLRYNSDGKIEGEKLNYYVNGNIQERQYYKNGVLQDSLFTFSKYGRKTAFYSIKNDSIAGEVIHYNNSGVKSANFTVVNDKKQGYIYRYHNNGNLQSKVNIVDNKAQGKYVSYYNTGEVREIAHYVDNLLDGPDTVYYRNGNILSVKMFKEDKNDGSYVEYFKNGNIKEKGEFLNGNIIGKFTRYNEDGSVDSEKNYDETGKENGIHTEYYDDGKPYFEMDYKKGDVVAYRYYDKTGNIIVEEKRKMGTFPFKGYHKNGNISMKGEYGTKYHQGEWEYYDGNSVLSSTKNYKNGDLEGKATYYYPSGEIKTIEHYKENKVWGQYIQYNPYKKVVNKGFYFKDEIVGPWNLYFPNGNIKQTSYYLNDEIDGFRNEYAPDGQLYRRVKYEEGVITKQWMYDQDGIICDSAIFINGCGEVVKHFKNSVQIMEKYNVINNNIHGKCYTYFPNGKIEDESNYFYGSLDGKQVSYFPNGKIRTEGKYELGEKVGTWKTYFDNGNLSVEEEYVDGENHGKYISYFEDGKKMLEKNFKHGNSDGEATYYSASGDFDQKRIYKDEYLLSYEYKTDKGFKKVDVNNETAEILSYFPNGNIARKFTIDKGWYQGDFKEYYSNGQVYEEATFYNNDYDGVYSSYYPDGKIRKQGNYAFGEKDGEFKEYYQNGKIKKECSYMQGYLHGPYKIYDKNGSLIHHYTYSYSEIVEIIK